MKTLNNTTKTKKLSCSIDFAELYKEAEGEGFSGWFCPVWADIRGDRIELSLGGPVSQGTTFLDDNNELPLSWVGRIDCWTRTYGEDDAENWAQDNNCNAADFDCEEEFIFECQNWDTSEMEREMEEAIRAFAAKEGYEVFFE